MSPPYWQTEGYGVPCEWNQYELAVAKLRQIERKAVISLNDHRDIGRCFEGFGMESVAFDYTMGGGANRAERQELIIYSWDREAEPAGLF